MILIKHQFSYQNNFLKNEFFKDLKLPADAFISDAKATNIYTIKSSEGKELFNLGLNYNVYDKSSALVWLGIILFFL